MTVLHCPTCGRAESGTNAAAQQALAEASERLREDIEERQRKSLNRSFAVQITRAELAWARAYDAAKGSGK